MADGPWAQYQQQTDAKPATDGPWSMYGPQTPPQMEGGWRLPAMAGSNVAKGAADTLGLPGDAMQSQPENPLLLPFEAISSATRWGLNKLGLQQPDMVPGELPTGKQIEGQFPGVINRRDLQPQTEGERILSATGRGVGSALPLAMGGPLTAARALISGAGSGVGSYEGQKYGGNAGAVVGGLLGGVGSDAAIGGLGKAGGAAAGLESDALAPYQRQGIPPRMVGDVTQNTSLQFLQQYAGKMPGGVGATSRAAQASLHDFSGAVENAAGRLGPQDSPQAAGETLQNSARQWIKQVLPAKNQQVFGPVNQLVPQDAPTPLPNYRAMLEKLTTSRPGMEETSGVLQNSAAKELLGALDKDVPAGGTARWDTVHGIAQDLGDKMGTPEFVQKMGQDNLNKLYGALAQDRRATADAYGARAYFDQANKQASANYAIRDNVLSKYVSSKNPTLESIAPDKAATTALNSNNDLQVIRQQMPQAANALGAYAMRRLGKRAGQGGTETSSPASFLTDFNKQRMSRPEGTAALYGDQGSKDLADLATVANNSKSAQQFANHSGTAGHAVTSHVLSGLGGAVAAPFLHGGNLGEAAGALVGVAGLTGLNRALAAGLTSPRLTRLVTSPNLAPRNSPQGVVPLAGLLGASAPQLPAK